MKVKFDSKKFEELSAKLKDEQELENAFMAMTKEIAQDYHKKLLRVTPVDTGNLRKNWGGNNLLFEVNTDDEVYSVEFLNQARNGSASGHMYASDVNDGHSKRGGGWVFGQFFVEKAINMTEPKVSNYVDKHLNRWFRWCNKRG